MCVCVYVCVSVCVCVCVCLYVCVLPPSLPDKEEYMLPLSVPPTLLRPYSGDDSQSVSIGNKGLIHRI